MKQILAAGGFIFLMLSSIICQSQVLHVFQNQTVRPVLIGKNHNIVLELKIEIAPNAKPISLQELYISSSGTSEPDAIRALRVFGTKDSSKFFPGHVFDKARTFSDGFLFRGDFRLQSGINYFWLSVELENESSLDGYIRLECLSMKLSDGSMHEIVSPRPFQKLRIGHALKQRGQGGVDTYRIPGLATTNTGTLIAVYDIRRNGGTDLQEDIDVGMSRSTDGGQSWEAMKVIMDMKDWGGKGEIENGIGDPSVLVDRETNTIWVAAIWAHGHPGQRNWYASKPGLNPEQTSQFVLVKSIDDGLTWSEPLNITKQIKDPQWHLLLQGPGKGITLEDGTLVFPAQFKDEEQVPHSTLIYSKDHGETWQIGTGAKSKTTESQVVQLSDGSLMLNMRDDRGRENPAGGFRSVAITRDLGQTWQEHPSSGKALPEPVCMGSLIQTKYQGKSLLLFSNPAVPKGPRRAITIKVSKDEGMTWPRKYHTLINQDNCYGYSCMTMVDKQTVGILYEGPGEIYFQRIPIQELLAE